MSHMQELVAKFQSLAIRCDLTRVSRDKALKRIAELESELAAGKGMARSLGLNGEGHWAKVGKLIAWGNDSGIAL